MTRSLRESLAHRSQPILLGLGFALLVAISSGTLWLVQQTSDDAQSVIQAQENQRGLTAVLLALRRAESYQRGFLLVGQPEYEQGYRLTLSGLAPVLENLKTLQADGHLRESDVAEIMHLIDDKLAEMEKTIQLYSAGQTEAARGLVAGGAGRDVMENLRTLIGRLSGEQRSLLNARTGDTQQSIRWLAIATVLGTIIIMLLAAASVWLLRRSNLERDEALDTLEATNANLETTIQTRTADLREANEEIQRFAYIVSHDLRSPLVNIMGFTSELEAVRDAIFSKLATTPGDEAAAQENQELGRDFDEAIGFIRSATVKMDRLINAVLRLSREGRREFRPERLNLNEIVGTIVGSVSHQASEADAKITVGDLPSLTSDRLSLEQILSNLIDNALKYLQSGRQGEIEISGSVRGIYAVIQVSDNGRGIHPDDHQRVFDLFRRAGAQDRPGEGIGLAHVRALVRRLGGTLSLNSAPDEGSTFTITLPREWNAERERSAA